MAKKEVIKVIVDTGDSEKRVKGVGKAVDKLGDKSKIAGGKVKAGVGGLRGLFTSMKTAILGAIPALQSFKVALISTGVGAIAVALGTMVSLFVKATNKGAEFAKSLSTLEAVSGASDEALQGLANQAKELGASTQFTAVQVVSLQTELAKLGFVAKDIENSTPAILDLASSLEVDLANAAELAGSTVRSFGLTTGDTQKVVDVMALSTSSSALNFEALRESLKVVAPTARATNVTIEKTTALLGVLANNGLKGSVAGTGLSKTFIELNKKGLTLEEGMSKVLNSTNKLGTAIDLVGVIGAKSFLSLAESGKEIEALEDTFNDAAGAAKKMAEIRLDNLAGDTTKLSSAWEGFLLSIEDGSGILNKMARGVVQFATGTLDVIDKLFTLFSAHFNEIKETTSSGWTFLSNSVSIGVERMKIVFNELAISISKIPIIGKAIDAAKLKGNVDAARDEISRLRKEIDDSTLNGTYQTRVIQRLIDFEDRKNTAILEKNKELANKIQEQKDALTQEEIDKLKEAESKRQSAILKIREKFKRKNEDLEDTDALAKLERQYERDLIELERLGATKEQKLELTKYYEGLIAKEEQKIIDDFEQGESDAETKTEDDRLANLGKKYEKELEEAAFFVDQYKSIMSGIGDFFIAETERQLIEEENKTNALNQELNDRLLNENLSKEERASIQNQIWQNDEKLRIAQEKIEKKRFIMQKAANISMAVVDTYLAATKALKQFGGVPTGLPAMAATIATGLVNVATIARQKFQSSSAATPPTSAGGGGSGGGSGGVGDRDFNFNLVGNTQTNQLAEAIQGQFSQPLKAFVVSKDVTTQQELDANIKGTATF